jgi:NADPH-dependent 2,4-dienoyl-CoA reductase/sulfur reductase-like enzyme
MSTLIIGASVAGSRTALALRQKGYTSPITILSEESHWPYDKPPLSKALLAAGAEPVVPSLLTQQAATDASVDIRLNTRAVSLDVPSRTIRTEAGEAFSFDTLVIATGVQPRKLPVPEGMAGVYTLRNLEDAVALRAELDRDPKVAVVGAGFIGAEFAAAARTRGLDVSIIETQDVPMGHIFGTEVGAALSSLHALNGTAVYTGAAVSHFAGEDRVQGVVLADGRTIDADLVVVGIGAVPATGWLVGSGLPVSNGIECTADLQVAGHPGIYAAGDVALRPHPKTGVQVRIEHWTNAGEHGDTVAAAVTGNPPPTPEVPYVWSDQYGARIQILGRPSDGVLSDTSGSVSGGKYSAVYTNLDGEIAGAVAVNDSKIISTYRKAMRHGQKLADLRPPVTIPTTA